MSTTRTSTSERVGAYGRLLLVTGANNPMPDVVKTLRSVVSEVSVSATPKVDPAVAKSMDLVLVNYDRLTPEEKQSLLLDVAPHVTNGRLVLLSEGKTRESFVDLFGEHVMMNLLARDPSSDPNDLIVTVRKLLANDIFGLEKYFSWGVPIHKVVVGGSKDCPEVVDFAEELARSVGANNRLVSQFSAVADEFTTNACYNAPVDSDGKSLYRNLERGKSVVLPDGKSVEVRLASDGQRIGISTSDAYGSLSPKMVLNYLAKCFRKGEDQIDDKEGGAGLGFYLVFESLSHFIINIEPGVRTEVIGLIDIRGNFRDFAQRTKSFNIFVSQPDKAAGGA